ncbi:hypothetical protein N0M98_21540 [Paenibacillus doosanensis]|uniref:Uncharacterized protein n=1 Tax=Paenibacillus konkukensis TaxID=2020716 RepID=A0ABY4RJP3_9BACL|nr:MULTISPECIES: hypothetical protein [Paenibacillus]MCS7462710.1 hypothetical protein [Paenibacillus doosanensis]UQZ82335.1 hypothetical protein SK3146_01492 [Paenibacillus konkukensis]
MAQQFGLYMLVAVFICLMLVLLVDVVRKSKHIVGGEQGGQAKESAVRDEQPPVYPLYVDCSRDFLQPSAAAGAEELHRPAPWSESAAASRT